jgi:small-conductance mechanosensitive channel
MNHLFSSQKSQRIGVRASIVLCCFVLFLLNLYLNYHFGLAQRNMLRSFLYAIPLPISLAIGLLQWTVQNKARQPSLAWYKDDSVLQRLWIWPLFLICIPLLINSLLNNELPDVGVVPFLIVAVLLMLYLVVQKIRTRRSSDRAS